jgi:hypothetical protein
MSTDRDVTRIVRSWLEDGATALPDRVLDNVLDQLPATPQRRAWWPTRRFREMNMPIRIAVAAAAVAIVAVVGMTFLPRSDSNFGAPAPTPSPTPSASPHAYYQGALSAGTYVMTPFVGVNGLGVCSGQPGCTESPADDTIRVIFTVPEGFEGTPFPLIWSRDGDTGIAIGRGGGLHSDPCHAASVPDIPVGPTVDDFAKALADHPILDATTPTDVTFAGYAGKYVDLQLAADITGCTNEQFWPWEPGMYAQGSSHRWHLWILDVEGTRVVVQVMDYAKTSAADLAKLQSVVDSLQIEP